MYQRKVTRYVVKFSARIDDSIVKAQKVVSQHFLDGERNPYFGRNPAHSIASITLLDDEETVAIIDFYYPDNGSGSYYDPAIHPPAYLAFSIDRFTDIIEVLRQEKPVYVIARKNARIGAVAYLTTEHEEVGEQEGK